MNENIKKYVEMKLKHEGYFTISEVLNIDITRELGYLYRRIALDRIKGVRDLEHQMELFTEAIDRLSNDSGMNPFDIDKNIIIVLEENYVLDEYKALGSNVERANYLSRYIAYVNEHNEYLRVCKEIKNFVDKSEFAFKEMRNIDSHYKKRFINELLSFVGNKDFTGKLLANEVIFYNTKFYEVIIIKNFEEFIMEATPLSKKDRNDLVKLYRGQTTIGFPLVPPIYRNDNITFEAAMLKDMIGRYPDEFPPHMTTFEKLVKLQHYDMPTRLLDFSTNPLVGLYFASDDRDFYTDGVVFELATPRSLIDSYEEFYRAFISNVATFEFPFNTYGIEEECNRKIFNNRKMLDRLRYDNVTPYERINADKINDCYFTRHYGNNRRITAQQGLFLLFGFNRHKLFPARFHPQMLNGEPGDSNLNKIYVINGACKDVIQEYLNHYAINGMTLFPEIDKASNFLKQYYIDQPIDYSKLEGVEEIEREEWLKSLQEKKL